MFINNLNLDLIEIKDPKVINNNEDEYFFDILYDNKDFIIECNNNYKLVSNNSLIVDNKLETNLFFNIYKKIIELFFNSHEEWFNDKLTYEKIKSMFNNYLVPNIEENCLNLIINKSIDLSDNYLNSQIIPKIKISGLIFKNEKITVYLELLSINLANNIENEIKENSEEESTLNENEEYKEPVKENSENTLDNEEHQEKNKEQEDEEEEEDEEEAEEEEDEEEAEEEEEENSNLKEINIENNNLESIDFNLTDEDYYIIYNILNNNIKDNLNNSVLNLLKERNVNIGKGEIDELLNESDEEDSDTESYNEEYSDNENSIS